MESDYSDQHETKRNIIKQIQLSNNNYEYGNLEFYHCTLCPFKASIKVNLFAHTKTVHKKQQAMNNIDSILENYFCENCDFSSFSILLLTKHVYSRCQAKRWIISNYSYETSTGEYSKQHKTILMFNCDYCQYETDRKYNLKLHLLRKHAEERKGKTIKITWFKCDHCQYKTRWKHNLKSHLESHPNNTHKASLLKHTSEQHSENAAGSEKASNNGKSGPKSHACTHCSYTTIYSTCLKRHITRHHADLSTLPWFKCEQCEFKTKENGRLKRHILVKHTPEEEIKWFCCDQCTYKAKEKSRLVQHVTNLHSDLLSNSRTFKCDYCLYIAGRKIDLRLHLIRKHSDEVEVFKCDLCQYKTLEKIKLEGHIRGHSEDGQGKRARKPKVRKDFVCDHCSYTAKRDYDMRRHISRKHASEVEVKWYQCEHCTYKGKLKKMLDEHVSTVHGESCTESKSIKCDYCSFISMKKIHVNNHMIRKHPNKVEISECDVCEFKTLSKLELEEHIQKGHGEKIQEPKVVKEFLCDHCTYKTKKNFDLTRHMLARHPDFVSVPWLKCEYCTFKSKDRSHLKKHNLKKHSSSAENQEPEYDQSYKTEQKYLLEEHMETVHSDSLTESGSDVINVPI